MTQCELAFMLSQHNNTKFVFLTNLLSIGHATAEN